MAQIYRNEDDPALVREIRRRHDIRVRDWLLFLVALALIVAAAAVR